jgi:hypothetical protein
MNARAHIALAATAFDPILADAWRYNTAKVGECLIFIKQHRRVIAERDDKLCTGTPVHSAAYVAQCERLLSLRLATYLKAVRNVSECEVQMAAIGMQFASDA